MEGFFVGSWTSKAKVGDLNVRVRTRRMQQNVLGLCMKVKYCGEGERGHQQIANERAIEVVVSNLVKCEEETKERD